MAVLDVAKKSLEVILVCGCSLMLFSFEGCVFDVRATVFAPVFGLRDRVSAIGKRRYRDMSNTRDRITVDFQYSDMPLLWVWRAIRLR